MRVLVEYEIISGQCVEKRRSWMNVRKPGEPLKGRAPRIAGNTSKKKMALNKDAAVRRLAQSINTNMQAKDLHMVLRYDDAHLPPTYEEAEALIKKALDKARYKFKKTYGRNPKVIWNTADWSPKHGCVARLHHHVVAEAAAETAIRDAWDEMQAGDYSVNLLDSRPDHTQLAYYMLHNVQPLHDRKKYHCSRNLAKPIITEPTPVAEVDNMTLPKDASIQDYTINSDEEGRIASAYMRYTLPVRPYVRGGKIVIPRPRQSRRKGRFDEEKK